MIVWSIQEESFFEKLRKEKIVYGDYRRVSLSDRIYYRWMSKQMYKRGVAKDYKKAPIWAWYVYENKEKRRPDLRHSQLLPEKARGIRIELEVPDRYCLLSQFEMWTYVLSNNYIPSDFDEFERIEANRRNGSLTQDMIIESWDRIFDLKFGKTGYWKPFDQREIQVCLPFMSKEWVKKVDFFIAR